MFPIFVEERVRFDSVKIAEEFSIDVIHYIVFIHSLDHDSSYRPALIVALCDCVPPVENVVSARVKFDSDSLMGIFFPTGPGTTDEKVTTPRADVALTVFKIPEDVEALIAAARFDAVAVTDEPILNSLATAPLARAVNVTPFMLMVSAAEGAPVKVPVVEAETAVSA